MKTNTTKIRSLGSLVGIALLTLGISFMMPAHAHDFLYIGDAGTDDGGADDSVKRFDAETGRFLGNFVAPNRPGGGNGGLNGPRGLIFTMGELIVVNQNLSTEDFPVDFAGEILSYRRNNGKFVDALVPCNPPALRDCDPNAPFLPRGMIRGPGRTVYVANSSTDDIVPSLPGELKQYDANTGAFLGDLDATGFTTAPFFPRGAGPWPGWSDLCLCFG